MARLWLLALTLLCAASGSAFAAPSAAEVKPSVVAIVDVQRILQASKAATSVQEQLEKQRSKFQDEITAEEADLREAEKSLTKLRETASADAYAEQEQKLRQRFLTVERHVQARRKAWDQAHTDSMATVREGIIAIVSEIAQEKGVNLVVVKQQVIWNNQNIDITEEVLSRLDKKLPTIQVKLIPEEEFVKDPPILARPKNKGPKTDPNKP